MDLGLRGKVAVVTGATRGIGRAIAETLASEGCDVAICARNADGVREAVQALAATGVRATGAALDVSDGEALKAWVAAVGEELGGIDLLISNATGFGVGVGEEAWHRCFEVDLMGAVRSFEVARPSLERAAAEKGDAAMVVISSTSALETSTAWAYGAMKAALIHLAKGLAREEAAKRVRVNVVSPGIVYHDGGYFQRVERSDPEQFRATLARIPLGRMATPAEVARAVAFLASPASSFTTGAHLVVDGAFTTRVHF